MLNFCLAVIHRPQILIQGRFGTLNIGTDPQALKVNKYLPEVTGKMPKNRQTIGEHNEYKAHSGLPS